MVRQWRFLALLITLAVHSTSAYAQSCSACTPVQKTGWTLNNFTVRYATTGFSAADKQAIEAAMASWNQAYGGLFTLTTSSSADVLLEVDFELSGTDIAATRDITAANTGGPIRFNPDYLHKTNTSFLRHVALHEFGHAQGFSDVWGSCDGATVMYGAVAPSGTLRSGLSSCDTTGVQASTPPPGDDGGGGVDCPGCDANPLPWTGGESPVVIDVFGNGYDLTSARDGVEFDISPGGRIERTAWTHGFSDDAFLVLDRDGDGLITSGVELFGNHTEQPGSTQPNGFTALGVFDGAEAGGDGDGLITSSDAVFSALRLWTDTNHNGVSEPHELAALAEAGVETIDLDYRIARRQDQHGNVFRYRASVTFVGRPHSPRWAYDVFFVVE
jgi:hypothetical protein